MEDDFKFIGRVEQLQDLLKILKEKRRVTVINGPPGSGKSIFVDEVYKMYKTAEQEEQQCGTRPAELIHVDCCKTRSELEFANTIMACLSNMSKQDKHCLPIGDDELEREIIVNQLVKAVAAFFRRLHPQHIFLFIDNINMNRKDIVVSFIVEMFKQRDKPSNLSVLLTSNLKLNSPSVRFRFINIGKFTDDEAMQLFEENFDLKPDKNFVKYVNEICSGNPAVLQLVGLDLTSENYLSQRELQFLLQKGHAKDVVNRDNLGEAEQWYTQLKQFFEKRLPKIVPDRLREVLHFHKEFRAEDLSTDPSDVAMNKNRLVPLIRANAVDFNPESGSLRVPELTKSYMADQDWENGPEKDLREHQSSQSSPAAAAAASCPEKIPTGSIKEKFSGLSLRDVAEGCEAEQKLKPKPTESVGRSEEQNMNQLSPGGQNIRNVPEEVLNICEDDPQIASNLMQNNNNQIKEAHKSVDDQKRKLEQFEPIANLENVVTTVTQKKSNLPDGSVPQNQFDQVDQNTTENPRHLSRRHAASDASTVSTEDNERQHFDRSNKMNSINTESIEDNEVQPSHDPKQMVQGEVISSSFGGYSERLPEVKPGVACQGETSPGKGILPTLRSLDTQTQMKFPEPTPQLHCRLAADTDSVGVPFSDGGSLNIASAGPGAMTQTTIEAYSGQGCLQKQTAINTSDGMSRIHGASELHVNTGIAGCPYVHESDGKQHHNKDLDPCVKEQSMTSAYAELPSNQRHSSGAPSALHTQIFVQQDLDHQGGEQQWVRYDHANSQTVQPPMTDAKLLYQPQPTNLYGPKPIKPFNQDKAANSSILTANQVGLRHQAPFHSHTDLPHQSSNIYQRQPDGNGVYYQQSTCGQVLAPRADFEGCNPPGQFQNHAFANSNQGFGSPQFAVPPLNHPRPAQPQNIPHFFMLSLPESGGQSFSISSIPSNPLFQFSVPPSNMNNPSGLQHPANTGQQRHPGHSSTDVTSQNGNVFPSNQRQSINLHQRPQQLQHPPLQYQDHQQYMQQLHYQQQQQQQQQQQYQQQQQQWQQQQHYHQQQQQQLHQGSPYQMVGQVGQESSVSLHHNPQHSVEHPGPSADLHGRGHQQSPDQYGGW